MEVRPGYKETEVGVIPEDWGIAKLPHVVWYQEGPGVRNYQFTSSGVKLLNGTNIENGKIHLDKTSRYISEQEAYGWYSHFMADAGDIVIACSGISVSRFDEKVGVLSSEHLPLCMNTSTMRFKVCSPRLDRDYFKHFLRSQVFKNQISGRATGSAQLNFGPAHVTAASIPLPDNTEQEAIAEALSDADAYIESQERLIAKKSQVKQGAMQELLTGKRRLVGFGAEWKVRRLKELGEFRKGRGITREHAQSGLLPCVRYGEIYTTHHDCIKSFQSWISPDVAQTATPLKKGDLLFAGSGETKAEIGKCVAFVSDCEAYAGGDIVILRPRAVDSLFLGYVLNTPSINRQKSSRGQGDAVVHISASALAEIRLPLPEQAEQTAIATILSEMDAEITALEDKLAKARRIKQGMMQELLTGRIRLV